MMEVRGRVLVLGVVAAGDMPADKTLPQMHPVVADFDAVFADTPRRGNVVDLAKMRTGLCHL